MTTTSKVYPLKAVRALAFHCQGLATKPGSAPSPTLDTIRDVITQIGCVQIDTLHVVQRSHYLILWSRLGCYDPGALDRLAYDSSERFLFEYWYHAASLIPLSVYRYCLPFMRRIREGGSRWAREWLSDRENVEFVEAVYKQVQEEGPLRAADFGGPSQPGGGPWSWRPAKMALEYLYNVGDIMIANRINFQRVYDLRERVLPDWVDVTEPTNEEANRYLVAHAARALGTCEPMQVAEYPGMKRGTARPFVEALIAEGILVTVQATLSDGQNHTLIVHRDNLPTLEQAADGALPAERTTFLSPFDSLFWARGRDEQFWGFRSVLEAYKPAADRIWGYFCLPILHKDRLVGRFDPKLERKSGTLHLKALYLEPGVEPEGELVTAVAGAMQDFMAFHGAADLVIERSEPAVFRERLLAAL